MIENRSTMGFSIPTQGGSSVDPFSAVTAGINTLASLGTGIANTVANYKQADWMKQMQERAWEREDTAVQRRVADLKAAGLSPTLAAGSSAQSSSPIQVQSPQVDQGLAQLNAQKLYLDLIQQKENIAQTHADRLRTEAQTQGQQIANMYTGERMQHENKGLDYANQRAKFEIDNQDIEKVRRLVENDNRFKDLDIKKQEEFLKIIAVEQKQLEFDEMLRAVRIYRSNGAPYGSSLPQNVPERMARALQGQIDQLMGFWREYGYRNNFDFSKK
jgi:hypothetical protein